MAKDQLMWDSCPEDRREQQVGDRNAAPIGYGLCGARRCRELVPRRVCRLQNGAQANALEIPSFKGWIQEE